MDPSPSTTRIEENRNHSQSISPYSPQTSRTMKYLIPLSILFSAAFAALTDSPTIAPGAVTVTILPTQVVVGDATLTRNAPGTFIGGTPVSLGSSALVIGTSTIPFPAAGVAPIYTVAGQTVTAGPAGIAVAGSTISNNGPAVTISGAALSLGSFGLVLNGESTLPIPSVQPLQSVFPVGGQSVTEQYGRIVFPSAKPVVNISIAATGTAVGPVPTSTTEPFLGAAVRTGSGVGVVIGVLCGFALIML